MRPGPSELDSLVVERLRRGERGAQEAFLRRYLLPLHGLVRRARLRDDSEDLLQELMEKLLDAVSRFDPHGPATLTTWVFTVAHRWLIDQRRQRHLVLAPLEAGVEVPDPQPSPEALAAGVSLAELVDFELSKLPDAQRRVFVLVQLLQQPLEQVAQVEKVPVGTVKSRLHRARAQVVAALERHLGKEHGRESVSR